MSELAQQLYVVSGHVMLALVWVILVMFPVSWLMIAIHWLTQLGQFLLARLQLKGLLLTVGAFMFVVAKGMSAAQLLGWVAR